MNFKSIEKFFKKFFKKNYKKIIVVCLIILLFSNKMYEDFTTTDALNAVASTEKKVNDMALNVGPNNIDFKSKIRLSGKWSGYPDKKNDQAEIANDRDNYKKLMIIGNKSAGGVRRVGVWDHLQVHGSQNIDKNFAVGGSLTVKGTSSQNRIVTNGIKINDPKKGAKTQMVESGYYGSWRGMKTCPDNTYVCGLEGRIEGKQGGGDDTAMNGIKMKCCLFNP
jgi:hypothetical protein